METYKLYNNEVELTFDPVKHMYKVNDKIVFGVTSICGILDKKALMYWAVNMAIKHLETYLKGKDFIGIERDSEYMKIAEARINNTQKGLFS